MSKTQTQINNYRKALRSRINFSNNNINRFNLVNTILTDAENKGYEISPPKNVNFSLYDNNGVWIAKFKVFNLGKPTDLSGDIDVIVRCKDGKTAIKQSIYINQFAKAFGINNLNEIIKNTNKIQIKFRMSLNNANVALITSAI